MAIVENWKARACRDHSFLHSRGQSGQAVVEYVLILMVVVVVASLIVRQMVSRDPDDPGFVIQKWVEVIDVIRTDSPDTASPPPP